MISKNLNVDNYMYTLDEAMGDVLPLTHIA